MMFNDLQEYGAVLTLKEACEVLRLSPNSVYDLLHTGKLKAVYVKKKWLIPKQAILELIGNICYRKKQKKQRKKQHEKPKQKRVSFYWVTFFSLIMSNKK